MLPSQNTKKLNWSNKNLRTDYEKGTRAIDQNMKGREAVVAENNKDKQECNYDRQLKMRLIQMEKILKPITEEQKRN